MTRFTLMTLGVLAGAVAACATEHAVVATLESGGSAGIAGAGGSVPAIAGHGGGGDGASPLGGSAGALTPAPVAGTDSGGTASGGSGNVAGALTASTVGGTGGGTDSVSFGGSNRAGAGGDDGLGGNGLICTCASQSAVVCGSDGVTYDLATCGEACPSSAECLHECPCSDVEPEPPGAIWLPFPSAQVECPDGFICLGDLSSTVEPCAMPPCMD